MKHLYFLLIFLINITIHAQKIQRSTFSSSGNSIQVTVLNKEYYVSQSIGQKSIIGSLKNSNYTIRQGFQQYLLIAGKPNQTVLKFSASVYPNPVDKSIKIVLNEELTTNLVITIYDILGRLQYQNAKKHPSKFDLDLSFLSTGTYFMTLIANGKNQQYKLIKN
ncbi:T9SS type A sorting domain-containing protein [Lutibacter profundi]|nr:T9SS type A sorting domain-containing protein [Lutibacter profundi]